MLTPPHSHTSVSLFLSRAEEQQEKTDDLGLSTVYEEDKQQYHPDFILPCPYLSGRRHAHDAEPAQVLSPVMEAEMKRSEGEAKGKRYLVSMMTLEVKVVFSVDLLQSCKPLPASALGCCNKDLLNLR